MIIEAFVISVLVALIRKGSFKGLGAITIKHSFLFVLPFIIFAGVCAIAMKTNDQSLLPYVRIANVVQFVILIAAMVLNRHIKAMRLAALGTFCNLLAVASNGGVMPMSAKALRAAGLDQLLTPEQTSQFMRHSIASPETHLKFLTDVIPVNPLAIAQYIEQLFTQWHMGWIATPGRVFIEKLVAWRFTPALAQVMSVGDLFIAIAIFVIIQHFMCRREPKPETESTSQPAPAESAV